MFHNIFEIYFLISEVILLLHSTDRESAVHHEKILILHSVFLCKKILFFVRRIFFEGASLNLFLLQFLKHVYYNNPSLDQIRAVSEVYTKTPWNETHIFLD